MYCKGLLLFLVSDLSRDDPQDVPTERREGLKGRAAAAAMLQHFIQFLSQLSGADSAGRILVSAASGGLL
jgi:hypothetical protein